MARIVTPTFTTDHDGADVVLVPLATGGSAKVLVADWRNLTAAGWSPRWTLNSSGDPLHPEWAYVRVARTRATGRLVTVSRLILGAGKGRIVRYRDGDRTNLRRDNLRLAEGQAKRRDADTPRARGRMPSAKAMRVRQERVKASLSSATAAVMESLQARTRASSAE